MCITSRVGPSYAFDLRSFLSFPTDSSQELDDTSFWTLQSPDWKTNAAKVTLKRAGYYTIPQLDKLEDYVCGETCVVPNFTVGRENYGNVYFSGSFDIYGLNLDEIGALRNINCVPFLLCHNVF